MADLELLARHTTARASGMLAYQLAMNSWQPHPLPDLLPHAGRRWIGEAETDEGGVNPLNVE
jgi:hypothetical protein